MSPQSASGEHRIDGVGQLFVAPSAFAVAAAEVRDVSAPATIPPASTAADARVRRTYGE